MTDTAPEIRGGFPQIKPVEHVPLGLGRFVAAMRRLQDLTVSTNPDSSMWAAAAQHVENACALLDGHQVPEALAPAGRVIELPGLGHPLLATMEGHFTQAHVGGNHAVHGGMIPLFYDLLFGMVVSTASIPPTRTITPIDEPLTAHGRITDIDDGKSLSPQP